MLYAATTLSVVKVKLVLNGTYFELLSVTFNVYCPGLTPVALYFNVPFSTLTFVNPSTAYSASYASGNVDTVTFALPEVTSAFSTLNALVSNLYGTYVSSISYFTTPFSV